LIDRCMIRRVSAQLFDGTGKGISGITEVLFLFPG
jgi:hypothetical protein